MQEQDLSSLQLLRTCLVQTNPETHQTFTGLCLGEKKTQFDKSLRGMDEVNPKGVTFPSHHCGNEVLCSSGRDGGTLPSVPANVTG